jgi:hypothetical protein
MSRNKSTYRTKINKKDMEQTMVIKDITSTIAKLLLIVTFGILLGFVIGATNV